MTRHLAQHTSGPVAPPCVAGAALPPPIPTPPLLRHPPPPHATMGKGRGNSVDIGSQAEVPYGSFYETLRAS